MLRTNFPKAGEQYLGGESDGWEYKTSFTGTTVKDAFIMLQNFLVDEGYENVPLPKDAKELMFFKSPPKHLQLKLFNERGYFHNPIKIFFPNGKRKENTLILCIYNEKYKKHLVRFHGLI